MRLFGSTSRIACTFKDSVVVREYFARVYRGCDSSCRCVGAAVGAERSSHGSVPGWARRSAPSGRHLGRARVGAPAEGGSRAGATGFERCQPLRRQLLDLLAARVSPASVGLTLQAADAAEQSVRVKRTTEWEYRVGFAKLSALQKGVPSRPGISLPRKAWDSCASLRSLHWGRTSGWGMP
jgi:hypothetical protein